MIGIHRHRHVSVVAISLEAMLMSKFEALHIFLYVLYDEWKSITCAKYARV